MFNLSNLVELFLECHSHRPSVPVHFEFNYMDADWPSNINNYVLSHFYVCVFILELEMIHVHISKAKKNILAFSRTQVHVYVCYGRQFDFLNVNIRGKTSTTMIKRSNEYTYM